MTSSYGARVRVVDHPAVADRLRRVRDRRTTMPEFRSLVETCGIFLAYEATSALPTERVMIETPLSPAAASRIVPAPVVAPILRAGLGLLPGFLAVVDEALVAHLGFYRDPQTLQPVAYYANVPEDLRGVPVFVLDPMLATGNSASAAVEALASRGALNTCVVALLAAPAGIERLLALAADVRIVVGAIDEGLNEHGFIMPGLGDAGDRMFGSAGSVPVEFRRPRR